MKSLMSALMLSAGLGLLAPLPAAAGIGEDHWQKIDPENTLFFELKDGVVVIDLIDAAAPGHAKRLKELVREGFYDGIVFHRVIDGFMAQGGDPTGTGMSGSSKPDLEAEFTFHTTNAALAKDPELNAVSVIGPAVVLTEPERFQHERPSGKLQSWMPHCRGVTSMARQGAPRGAPMAMQQRAWNSANSQFFWIFDDSRFLDRQYTAWGKIIYGQPVVDNIERGEPPVHPDKILRARVGADIPEAERLEFEVMTPDSVTVKENIARATKNGFVDACAIDIPVRKIEKSE